MWTGSWSDGRCGSTSVCGDISAERPRGCDGLPVASRSCSRTGVSGRRRLDAKSRMSREVHVRFREGAGVRLPRATRLVIICRTQRQAEHALHVVLLILQELKLQLQPSKTRLVGMAQEG